MSDESYAEKILGGHDGIHIGERAYCIRPPVLGGFYGTPHGLANAVILPYVLDYFGESVHKPLSELSDLVGLGIPGATDFLKKRLLQYLSEQKEDWTFDITYSDRPEMNLSF